MHCATDHAFAGGVHMNWSSVSLETSRSASSASRANSRRNASISGVSARGAGVGMVRGLYFGARPDAFQNPGAEPYGVARRVTARIVVEVGEDVQPFSDARRQPFRPIVQPLVGVGAPVLLRPEMEAHVDKGPDDDLAGGGALHVVEAEGDVMTTHQLVDAFVVPAGLAELYRMTVAARQCTEKDLEALEVQRPARWKLVKDRSEPRSQLPRVIEEARERIVGILQLLHVRQEAPRLHGVEKARWRLLAPLRERLGRRQPVEAVVDLDRIERQGVVREPARGRQFQIGGGAAPGFVL